MAVAFDASEKIIFRHDHLSGTARASLIDRWIYVFTAAIFVATALAGFVPDSFAKLTAIKAGMHAPFPLVLHFHAVLMASFLSLLLAQTVLVALDRRGMHMQLGMASAVLVPALVVASLFAVPAIYHGYWQTAQNGSPAARQALSHVLPVLDDILLMQLRIAVIFPLLMWIALTSRVRNPGLHKRLILLATAPLFAAAFDRITWLPNSMPASPLVPDIYCLLTVTPMFIWDLARNRTLHRAYLIFAAVSIPTSLVVYGVWDSPWWHATARHLMGV
jgi:hypothetical protein